MMLTSSFPNLIGGSWVHSGQWIENVNPSDTTDIIGQYAIASTADIQAAIECACDAQKQWSESTSQRRSDCLNAVAVELHERHNEIAQLLSREEGKTLSEATAEVLKSSHVFRYFSGEAVRQKGEHIKSIRPSIDVDVERQPVGVVGLITPWNFPISIPAWKAAPALAYGNSVILKPSELTCGSAWALADIIHRHLPAGVFQLVMGRGDIGSALCSSPRVAAVSFTGSSQTGAHIAKAVLGRGARLQMEMGGKNPLIVMEDADLDLAVKFAISGAFYSTGQRCTASSRLIVSKKVYEEFVALMLAEMAKLKVGHALDADTNIGPLISQNQLDRVLNYINLGKGEGAVLATGGQRLECRTRGFFLSPALFIKSESSYRINQEEIFGPVAAVIEADDIDSAISIANDTPYGLSAGIMTHSLAYASQFRKQISSGMAMINLPTVGTDYHVPFGGTGASAYGPREMGVHAQEFFTSLKTFYTAV